MKLNVLFIAVIFLQLQVKGEINYINYHKQIINAEEAIFLKKNVDKSIQLFESTFKEFDFCYIDDCLMAFQIALAEQKLDPATFFIKRAMDNGFELRFLKELSYSCVCDYYNKGYDSVVNIVMNYYSRNKEQLEDYQLKALDQLKNRLNCSLIAEVWERHAYEQSYKNLADETRYKEIVLDNFNFVKNNFANNVFLGEQNLGPTSFTLFKMCKFKTFRSSNDLRKGVLQYHPTRHRNNIPIADEGNYYGISPLYIMLFHHSDFENTYKLLLPYAQNAIKGGFLHPKEYAYVSDELRESLWLKTTDFSKCTAEMRKKINKGREALYLPSIELDEAKHKYAHRHNLHLRFGFWGYTR